MGKLLKHGETEGVTEFVPPHTGTESTTGIEPFLLRQVNPETAATTSAPSSDNTDDAGPAEAAPPAPRDIAVGVRRRAQARTPCREFAFRNLQEFDRR